MESGKKSQVYKWMWKETIWGHCCISCMFVCIIYTSFSLILFGSTSGGTVLTITGVNFDQTDSSIRVKVGG
jgi:hypothetical protein